MKFTKDGYDYISGDYEISKYYGTWAVWYKSIIVYLADTLKDAKEYCENHSKGNEKEYTYVI